MASVLIPGSKTDTPVTLHVSGKNCRIPFNVETPIDEVFLAALEATDIPFEKFDRADLPVLEPVSAPPGLLIGAGEGGDGEGLQGTDAVADDPVAPDPEFLDRPVAAIVPDLAGMTIYELAGVRLAEEGGKTRKTLMAEIEALFAAKTEG